MEKFKRISFVLAALFIIAALAIKLSKPEFQQYANYALGAGILFFLVSLYFERNELKSFFGARSTKHGLNALVMIILMLAIIGLANWVVNRHPMKYDTTKNQQFSLSPLTVNSLQQLKQPVKITAFFTEAQEEDLRQRMSDLLDNYKTKTDKLEIKVVDPLKNQQLTSQYGIQSNGTTVFESGTQKTTITTTSEEDVTNAILKVTSSKQVKVYFLTGHGESSINDTENQGMSAVLDEMKKMNYLVEELKDFSAKPQIPNDCGTLVIAAPSVALLDHEIKAIKGYLAAGGRVLVLDDPQADVSVAKIFEDYRVTPRNDVVVDDQYFFPLADVAVPQVAPVAGTPVTKEFNFQMFFPLTRSLDYKESEGAKEVYTPFAQTSQFSWGETDKQQAQFEEGKDIKGPLNVGLLVTVAHADKKERSSETRLAIFGDASFVQNGFVGIPGNRQIFLNSVAWLTEQENLIHLPPRDDKSDVMMLSSTQLNYLGLFLVIILPGLIIGAGITVWVRRKKL